MHSKTIVSVLYSLPCVLGLVLTHNTNPTIAIIFVLTLLFDVLLFFMKKEESEVVCVPPIYILSNPLVVLVSLLEVKDLKSIGLLGVMFTVRVLVGFFGGEYIKYKGKASPNEKTRKGLPKDVIEALASSSLSGSNYIVNMSTEGTVFPEEAIFNIMEILGAEQALVDDSYDKYSCIRSLNDELREVRRVVADYNRQLKREEQEVNRKVNKQIVDTYKSQKR